MFIQKRLRGILARQKVEAMRQEEMIFLGMARKPKTEEEIKNDPLKVMEKTRQERIIVRKNFEQQFKMEKENLKDEIEQNEGIDI